MRRGFLVRIAILLGILLVLWMVVGFFVFGAQHWQGDPSGSGDRDGPPPFVFLVFILIIVIAIFTIRRLRRSIAPIGQMMVATQQVAEGDYRVRIDAPDAGELGQFVTSFNTMVERLASNEDQRTRLLADVAHELRTPLAVIQGTLEGMIDGVYERGDDEIVPLVEQSWVIARLLDDLRTMSNAEAGAVRLDRVETGIREVLADVGSRFRTTAAGVGTSLVVEADDGLSWPLDPVRIRQVLDNLVTNAIRYAPGGEVRLSAGMESGDLVITVRDTGRGMPAGDAGRMFERFVKSADSGGSGLGLAIARSLVMAHGGTIGARSAPGAGTTVTIRLPG